MNHLIRIAVKNYYCKTFTQAPNNIKNNWNSIAELLGKKKKNNPMSLFLTGSSNEEVDNPNLTSNKFNEFFANHDSDEFLKFLKGNCKVSMFLYDTPCDEVNKLKSLI